MIERVEPRWQHCVVAAPGPSLTPIPRGIGPIIVVQDAWRMMPWADVLYGCDRKWWEHHAGTDFEGEKWSTHEGETSHVNHKFDLAEKYNLRLVAGAAGNQFSLDPSVVHYGNNSGFQAINLAILFGCKHIVLVGFDMRSHGNKSHFFGDHPPGLSAGVDYERFVKYYDEGAKHLPSDIQIINATPESALDCFPKMELDDALDLFNRIAA